MPDTPYPISSKDPAQAIQQMKQLIDELYQERVAGTNIGDVFTVGNDDVLTLNVGASGGLEKSTSSLVVKANPSGPVSVTASGVDVSVASTTKKGVVTTLPNDATQFFNGVGSWAVPSVSGTRSGFSAILTNQSVDVTGDNTTYNLTGAIWTELFDNLSDFADGTFTARNTAKHLFTGVVYLQGLLVAHTAATVRIVTTGRTYSPGMVNAAAMATSGALTLNFSVLADMTATDTAYVDITVYNGTKVVDIGATHTIFSCHEMV